MSATWKIAFVTDRQGSGYGGALYSGQMLSALRADSYAELEVIAPRDYPPTTIPLFINKSPRAKIRKWITWRTEADIDHFPEEEILASHRSRPFDACVFDGSLLGAALPRWRRLLPDTLTITVLHNVELDYVDSRSRLRNPHLFLKRRAVERAERLAASADLLVALHDHDSRQMGRLYGRQADFIFPITVRIPESMPGLSGCGEYALFLGSNFKPNIDAVAWIYRNLAPHCSLPIVILGKGMEHLKSRFPDHKKFKIVGAVDDLRPWYSRAAVVLSPIMSGGGMKVKNIEALAHGKRVFASPQSAVGLDTVVAAGHVRILSSQSAWLNALEEATTYPQGADPRIVACCRNNFAEDLHATNLRGYLDSQLRLKAKGC